MKGKKYKQEDYDFVFTWMEKHCFGREHARFRENEAHPDLGILPYIPSYITDRKFRFIISAMVQEGLVYSSAAWGYFFMPPIYPTALDIEAAKRALEERKSKALSTIDKVDMLLRRLSTVGVRDLFKA